MTQSQTLTVQLAPAPASCRPSGWKAKRTPALDPLSLWRIVPVVGSHTKIVPVESAEAMRVPSGL